MIETEEVIKQLEVIKYLINTLPYPLPEDMTKSEFEYRCRLLRKEILSLSKKVREA